MKLYEINREIENILYGNIDEETGEVVVDTEALEALAMERDEKIENIAIFIKNATSDISAIKEEEKKLAERRKSIQNRVDNATEFLSRLLDGNRFTTAKCDVRFRKTEKTETDSGFVDFAMKSGADCYLTYKEPVPNLVAIKQAIKDGCDFGGMAKIVERYSMSVK